MRRLTILILLAVSLLPALAHAVDRQAATLNPLFLNVSPRPVASSRTEPRLVENIMKHTYRDYQDSSVGGDWMDFPDGTAAITYGKQVDGGQWFEFTTTAGGIQRVWTSMNIPMANNTKYIVSFTVDSRSGTISASGNANVSLQTVTATGTTTIVDPAVGRHAMVFTTTSAGTATIRFGIGASANNNNNGTIRISNIMVECPQDQTRNVPWEYVNARDQRVFPYTYSTTLTGTLVNTPTLGPVLPMPTRSSILVIGDSFTNDPDVLPTIGGDFPYHMRRHVRGKNIAINSRGVTGQTIAQITDQIAAAFAETTVGAGAASYTMCIAEGGVNDANSGRTLAQMQADKLAQIAAIQARGMVPVLVNVGVFEAGDAGEVATIAAFNAWLRTLGYPLYDLYTDSTNGVNTYKTSWGSGDGLHPGQGYAQGSDIMAQRLADLIMLVGDR